MIDVPDKAIWMPPKPAIVRASSIQPLDIKKGVFPFPILPPRGAAAPVSYVANNASATTPTISAVPIGTAASGRVLAIFAYLGSHSASGGTAITNPTLTVGGNAATRVGFKSYQYEGIGGTVYNASGWWIISFATGTTANFVFSGAANAYDARVRVYSLSNLLSTTPVAFTNPALGSSVSSVSLNTNAVKDGIVLGGTTWADLTGAGTFGAGSFSGLTTDFRYDGAAPNSFDYFWTGYHLPTANESPRAISTTRGSMSVGNTAAFALSLR